MLHFSGKNISTLFLAAVPPGSAPGVTSPDPTLALLSQLLRKHDLREGSLLIGQRSAGQTSPPPAGVLGVTSLVSLELSTEPFVVVQMSGDSGGDGGNVSDYCHCEIEDLY